jgi:hypothetical protein
MPQRHDDTEELEKDRQEGTRFVQVESGTPVRMRVVNGPYCYKVLWTDTKDGRRKFVLPKDSQFTHPELKREYLYEVLIVGGAGHGAHKLFEANKGVAIDISKAKALWGSIYEPVFEVGKTGSGKKGTKWSVQAGPAAPDLGKPEPTYELDKQVRFSTKEDLDSIPPAPVGGVQGNGEGEPSDKATPEQAKLIMKLVAEKDLTLKAVNDICQRLFKVGDWTDLDGKQASKLIDNLKNYQAA